MELYNTIVDFSFLFLDIGIFEVFVRRARH